MTDEQRRRVEADEQRAARDALDGVPPPAAPVLLDEGQLQMVVLALAHLSVERPGWSAALAGIADRLGRRDLFDVLHAGRPTAWQCPDCRHPLRLITAPRAADRYVCRGCGRVWRVAECGANGPVFL